MQSDFFLLALMNGGRGAVAHPDRQYCFIRNWQPEARYVTCNDNKTFGPVDYNLQYTVVLDVR